MVLLPLPLAWLEGLGPLLVVAFWVIRQVVVAFQEQKAQEEAKKAAKPENPGLPDRQVVRREHDRRQLDPDLDPQMGRQGGRQEEGGRAAFEREQKPEPDRGARSEVEEFLRKLSEGNFDAGQQEARGAAGGAAAAGASRRRQPIDPFEEPDRRRRQPPQRSTESDDEIELLIDEDESSERRNWNRPAQPQRSQSEKSPSPSPQKAKRELRHLPESQLAENAAHLGESIADADDRIDARIHKRFDQRLGSLGQRDQPDQRDLSKIDLEKLNGAQRIKKLLTTPAGVRDAVILSEILARRID